MAKEGTPNLVITAAKNRKVWGCKTPPTLLPPLHVVSLSDIAAIVSLVSSVIYLFGFSGISFIQSDISEDEEEPPKPNPPFVKSCPQSLDSPPLTQPDLSSNNEDLIRSVVDGSLPSYTLESRLGDCRRAAGVRREALRRITGRSLDGLPIDGFDYASILGQCCELPVGYVQIPVGVAGPLVLDGTEYYVPMATTEGCLVASTNRGFKAILASGGAESVVLKDGMTRAPAVRFGSAKKAARLKFFVEDPGNFDTLSVVFNRFE
ncbi:3-hydroxy-3-methylglutaryl-coenzyme A reductase 1 [Acorus calamus]|uniref:3-hydroxy-3-methylglutaryl-coenzyme A reductase 1 n=1 Tax=Acorus calamus TaxID=4465 RepID=A0AAV9EI64_ACOCL|nr:3-hydroxy-3-methylglutaryl-coenzyme A reductase 1 [Acorus calamus]